MNEYWAGFVLFLTFDFLISHPGFLYETLQHER